MSPARAKRDLHSLGLISPVQSGAGEGRGRRRVRHAAEVSDDRSHRASRCTPYKGHHQISAPAQAVEEGRPPFPEKANRGSERERDQNEHERERRVRENRLQATSRTSRVVGVRKSRDRRDVRAVHDLIFVRLHPTIPDIRDWVDSDEIGRIPRGEAYRRVSERIARG